MSDNYKSVLSKHKWKPVLGKKSLELKYCFNSTKKNDLAEKIFTIAPDEQKAIKKAFVAWENVANIKFIEVYSDKEADILIRKGMLPKNLNGNTKIDRIGEFFISADIIFNIDTLRYSQQGQEGFKTILHEIGHAIGLKHTANSGNDEGPFLDAIQDNQANSVMSYQNIIKCKPLFKQIPPIYSMQYEPTPDTVFYPTTPMVYDVKAVQELYGKNNTYNDRDTVYSFKDDLSKSKCFYTIWDPKGTDTIDASLTKTNNLIDLRSGSDYRSKIGNDYFSIAYNTHIENVKSGDGNDVIHGNYSNVIYTGGGKDYVFLGYGTNMVHGGKGKKEFIFDSKNVGGYSSINHIEHFKSGIDKIKIKNYNTRPAKISDKDIANFDMRENVKCSHNKDYKIDSSYVASALKINDTVIVLYGKTAVSYGDIFFE